MSTPLFDKIASDYDSWYDSELGKAADYVQRRLIEQMFTPNGDSILEVGCGTGQYTVWLAKQRLSVTALDVSKEMMSKAQAKVEKEGLEVKWIQEDILNILEQLTTYNGILSVTAFEFIPNPEQVLRTLYKKLAPGGCLVIGLIAGNSSWSEAYNESRRIKPDSVFAHANFYIENDIRSWEVGGELEIGKALYFPPSVAGFEEAMIKEKAQINESPGFLVAKWTKV